MIETKWTFEPLDVAAESDDAGREDIISVVHWRVTMTDDADGFYATRYGSTVLDEPDGDFIDFDDVSVDDCKAWCLPSIGDGDADANEASVMAGLAADIEMQRNPPIVQKTPEGWAA